MKLIRNSTIYIAQTALGLLVLGGLLVHGAREVAERRPVVERVAAHAGNLELTDLCLFSEARYTRHLSQADIHTPFQEFPLSMEHFPTGSLVAPPEHLLKSRAPSD